MAAASQFLESRLEQIVRRRRELDADEAELITLIGEYTRSGDWQTDGYLNATAALANQCRMDPDGRKRRGAPRETPPTPPGNVEGLRAR